ncbi:MAG: hypothetical protein ACRENE_04080 [Polyangiaceae bacterium]
MPPHSYRTISVPQWTYDAAITARADLLQHGLGSVPEDILRPPSCPHCGGAVEHVTVGIEHVKCGGCGYSQQTVSANGNTFAQVGLGVVIGLGLAALLKAVSDAADPPRRLRAARPAPRKRSAKRRARSR